MLEILDTGSVVVSAKYMNDIVRKLPGDISIKAEDNHLISLQSRDIAIRLNGFSSDEYPKLPDLKYGEMARVSYPELSEAIKQTVFAAEKSDTRPILTGVNMVFDEKKLTFTATDSQRLAFKDIEIDSSVKGSFVIPHTTLNELLRLMGNYRDIITISFTANYILFKTDDLSLYSRLIAGKYPNTAALIPNDFKTVITLCTRALYHGIDRASLFAGEWKNNNVNLHLIEGHQLRISSNSSDIGTLSETQKINTIEGEKELSISLDGRFMKDALKAIKDEEIKLCFGGSMKPVLIEPIDHKSYMHLISPVRSYY